MTCKKNVSPLSITGYTPPRKHNLTFPNPILKEFRTDAPLEEGEAAIRANKDKRTNKRDGTLESSHILG
jgi:hypothetical protein